MYIQNFLAEYLEHIDRQVKGSKRTTAHVLYAILISEIHWQMFWVCSQKVLTHVASFIHLICLQMSGDAMLEMLAMCYTVKPLTDIVSKWAFFVVVFAHCGVLRVVPRNYYRIES